MDREFSANSEAGRIRKDLVQLYEEVSFADTMFGFMEDVEEDSSQNSSSSLEFEDAEEEENGYNLKENKAFWEEQEQLLLTTLYRSNSFESKVQQATEESLNQLKLLDSQCIFQRSPLLAKNCSNCLQKDLCKQLLMLGYNCTICKSRWRGSSEITSGEHTYLEVIDESSIIKQTRVLIELNFRAEFEIAKATEEYSRLVSQLPEVYVGKSERLKSVIKLLCSAAKKCMKEKKLHLAPWRKQKYMQAKWLGTCQRSMPTLSRSCSRTSANLNIDG